MSAQHTPTPWRAHKPEYSSGYVYVLSADGREVATCYGKPHSAHDAAAFIVKACNAHDELIAAIINDAQLRTIEKGRPFDEWRGELSAMARATLAKAGAL